MRSSNFLAISHKITIYINGTLVNLMLSLFGSLQTVRLLHLATECDIQERSGMRWKLRRKVETDWNLKHEMENEVDTEACGRKTWKLKPEVEI